MDELFREVLYVSSLFPFLGHQLVPQLLYSGFELVHLRLQRSPLLLQTLHLLLPQRLLPFQLSRLQEPTKAVGLLDKISQRDK